LLLYVCVADHATQNEYAENMSIEDCLQLAVKVLNKTMDSTAPAADKMELTTIQRINGKVPTTPCLLYKHYMDNAFSM
jgi:20S proteasome alpha/beta subunit